MSVISLSRWFYVATHEKNNKNPVCLRLLRRHNRSLIASFLLHLIAARRRTSQQSTLPKRHDGNDDDVTGVLFVLPVISDGNVERRSNIAGTAAVRVVVVIIGRCC